MNAKGKGQDDDFLLMSYILTIKEHRAALPFSGRKRLKNTIKAVKSKEDAISYLKWVRESRPLIHSEQRLRRNRFARTKPGLLNAPLPRD